MNLPLVSVIIPTYNRPYYLKETIESVVNQTYDNIEIIVIDDGSKNNYAEKICNEFKICRYFFKQNGGVSSSRNLGVLKSKGEFIAFLDDDDLWKSKKLSKQIAILNSQPKIDLVHSSAEIINENGQLTGKVIGASQNKIHLRSGYVFWNALGTWLVKSPTPLIRKSVFKKDMMFDESIYAGEDTDFYQRLFYRHKINYINEPLAYYRQYENPSRLSTQKEKYIGVEKKMYKNFLKMGIKNPIILNRIASRLLKTAHKRKISLKGNSKLKLSIFDIYFRPIKKLQEY
ncbi:glycosyltransferase family 2 protein [Urechidicola croceus]|uniref:Glycosyltransferase 2-like domain-containing protein n=1 Tax=Urechidicola croceus TaxID=1850246 RepID=A0A1D8P4J7_9FLAO|nr:glycosyltransferase [Urechidicola croceus]AOW19509.1 hypothetical protein LPB138_01905 [Urechidicola croceus]